MYFRETKLWSLQKVGSIICTALRINEGQFKAFLERSLLILSTQGVNQNLNLQRYFFLWQHLKVVQSCICPAINELRKCPKNALINFEMA